MPKLDFHPPSPENLAPAHIEDLVVRLAVAGCLAAFVAYRPWRYITRRTPLPQPETAQAQTLIAVSAAVMVAVIGDNMARAFGLVGLGSFIRFRSGIKDPRDAATLFVMIGIGMACGLGHLAMGLLATAFPSLVLTIFDVTGRARRRRQRLAILAADPRYVWTELTILFPGVRALEVPSASPNEGKLVVEGEFAEGADAMSILATLEKSGVSGVQGVSLQED